jgi:hypothetical protein
MSMILRPVAPSGLALALLLGLSACTNIVEPTERAVGGVLIGAGTGALIGSSVGGGHGGAIGAIVGAGVGLAAAVATTPEPVPLPPPPPPYVPQPGYVAPVHPAAPLPPGSHVEMPRGYGD